MCDNCRQELEVIDKDFTTEASDVVKFIHAVVNMKANFTLKMVVELLKGRSVKSAYGIPTKLTDNWQGHFKNFSEQDLHRLIIHLLIRNVLEE